MTSSIQLPRRLARILSLTLLTTLAASAQTNFTAPDAAALNALHEQAAPADRVATFSPNQPNGWLVSYWGCDGVDRVTLGSPRLLTSPEFTVTQSNLFFMWTGDHSCSAASLEVEGQPVALGLVTERWRCWDVAEFVGRKAVFKIYDVDRHEDQTKGAARVFLSATRAKDLLPVPQFKDRTKLAAQLPPRLAYDPATEQKRAPEAATDYTEKFRPQFHFTRKEGWMNDPNGMVYYAGEYHLGYQAANFWGYATSTNMIHWRQMNDAVAPDNLGAAWSGSTVVDWNNTSGFQTGSEPPLVAFYTSCGFIKLNPAEELPRLQYQSIVYSNDRGRTWKKFAGNPVLRHMHRDPKVFWHAPTKRWVMVLMLRQSGTGFFSSADLKTWRKESACATWDGECPDFFPLPVDGDTNRLKWVGVNAQGHYLTGNFDGKTFTPETKMQRIEFGKNHYATQTFNNAPEGRVIQMTWLTAHGNWGEGGGNQTKGVPRTGQYPGNPFNQQLTFPRELTLRQTAAGLKLFSNPIAEVAQLYATKHSWTNLTLTPGANPLAGLKHDLYDMTLEIEPGAAREVGLLVAGEKISFTPADRKLRVGGHANEVRVGGALKLRLLIDRISMEIFVNDGEQTLTYAYLPQENAAPLAIYAEGGEAKVRRLDVVELNSIWKK